jgi:formylmethanofuran dehydrogenase subunit C
MREVTLKLKDHPELCLEVEGVLPDILANKSREEIENMLLQYGNTKVRLSEFFDVFIERSEQPRLIFEGDLSRVKRIGFGMKNGEIVVKGNAGMYLGAFMEGGRILVEGNVGHFAGLNMRGGEIVIEGNCGDYLCASYRGEWRGMKGGTVIVKGNVGKEIGAYMQKGKIVVEGIADEFAGVCMKGGLIVLNKAKARLGASMVGGAIVVNDAEELLPGFFDEGEVENPEIEGEKFEGKFRVYSGDHAERKAKGMIFVRV